MTVASDRDARSHERRRLHRVKLAVPVQFSAGAGGMKDGVCPQTGVTRDISPGGVFLTLKGESAFAPGDILRVLVSIPWNAKRPFPFSRVSGLCRVVRVEPVPGGSEQEQGLALAFCDKGATMMGTTGSL